MKTLLHLTALVTSATLGLAAPSFAAADEPEVPPSDEQVQPPSQDEPTPPAVEEGNKDQLQQEGTTQEGLEKESTAAGKSIGLNEVPSAVKSSLEMELKGAELGGIKSEQRGDQTVYKAEIIKDGRSKNVILSSDGNILSRDGSPGLPGNLQRHDDVNNEHVK